MGMSVIASPLQSQIMWRRGALPAKKAGFSGCPLTACPAFLLELHACRRPHECCAFTPWKL